ncbi:CopC domain-containing protein YobA [Cronobacter sakazakii]|uniref:CopC domain-containing protein YobA n=1 Tax=Cronobacter sakazakii TaxID=28141 RepID=UPI000D7062C0|nr:CopC domain-containing protein YobA [Cronobacter sakazakii]MBR9959360.1 CopC domain-containing protein YobA [Cronobacter sakazakii]PWV31707.1 CopC domain-containing protein YobA [Cronobacter sakazakii]
MALFTARFCRALALVAAVMTTPAAWAHAHLKAQQPAANATVDASPEALTLTFSEGIEPAFSGVTLTGPDGKKTDTGAVKRAPNDDKQLVAPLAAPLASGEYQVQWHVVSVDGHKTKGSYRFSVK